MKKTMKRKHSVSRKRIINSKRGISPLIATVLLVAFAIALGAIVMNWARGIEESQASDVAVWNTTTCIVEGPMPTDPLAKLQIRYLNREISKQEYLQEEAAILNP